MSKKIKTFSVGFGKSDDEFEYARLVSQKFNTDHTELLIEPKNVGNVLTKIVWHQDEPLADGGGIATYLAAQLLSKHVKVVLVGEGGDELFGGYSWYKLGLPISSIFSESIRKKIYFYLTTFYNRRNSQFLNVFDLFNEIFESPKDDFLSRMIRFEIENILPNSLCMKVDKMMSAWGLEAREPYLDHKLVEFCFSLPINLKISANRNKIILRRIMKDLLPKGIITRRKHGFLLPTRDWLDGPLKEYSMGTILARDSFAKRIYPMSELREMLKKKKFVFEIERVNFVWRLFIFELWYKNYIKDY